MRRWLAALSLLLALGFTTGAVEAGTVAAASCERAAVAAAITSASAGDTVTVPAGRCTWTTNLTITKWITLQGAGMDQTTIVDGVSKTPYPNVSRLLIVHATTQGVTRLTGFTFQGGTEPDQAGNAGMLSFISADKTAHRFRFDHNRVIVSNTAGMWVHARRALFDHNVFDIDGWFVAMYTFDAGSFGDESWAEPARLGTDEGIFVESNTFASITASRNICHDGWRGSRVVFRYNHIKNCTYSNHGSESPGRQRGARIHEVYENTSEWTVTGPPAGFNSRSGNGVVFNNRTTRAAGINDPRQMFSASNFRSNTSYPPWGKCDGTSSWDGNDGPQAGYPCLDQTGRGQGTLISGSSPTPVGWPQQAVEPLYVWNNTLQGVVTGVISNSAHIQKGRDYFEAPKPGYTPFVYPHPLVTETPTPTTLSAPTNLQVR